MHDFVIVIVILVQYEEEKLISLFFSKIVFSLQQMDI